MELGETWGGGLREGPQRRRVLDGWASRVPRGLHRSGMGPAARVPALEPVHHRRRAVSWSARAKTRGQERKPFCGLSLRFTRCGLAALAALPNCRCVQSPQRGPWAVATRQPVSYHAFTPVGPTTIGVYKTQLKWRRCFCFSFFKRTARDFS